VDHPHHYRFIDTHCHFDFPEFDDDRHQVQQNCLRWGIEKLLVPSVGASNWHKVLRLAEINDFVEAGLGIHPCFLEAATSADLTDLAGLLRQHRGEIVALGEIGLDRLIATPLAKQYEFFNGQLALAFELGLPVIVHARRMNDEVFAALKRHRISRGVIHGFSGSLQQAEKYWSQGIRIGVGGVITYARAKKTRRAVAAMPLEALLLESDAPDMPLQGFQGQRNTPERIPLIFRALSDLRNEQEGELAAQLFQNSLDAFFSDA